MTHRRTVFLATKAARQRAHNLIDAAGGDMVMKLAKATRTDKQNRKLHPMIADIQRQAPEMASFSAFDIRMRFLDALGEEMRFLPKLEGEGFFPVGHRSSTLTIDQFVGLLELLYAYGAKHGVEWTDPETRAQRKAA